MDSHPRSVININIAVDHGVTEDSLRGVATYFVFFFSYEKALKIYFCFLKFLLVLCYFNTLWKRKDR